MANVHRVFSAGSGKASRRDPQNPRGRAVHTSGLIIIFFPPFVDGTALQNFGPWKVCLAVHLMPSPLRGPRSRVGLGGSFSQDSPAQHPPWSPPLGQAACDNQQGSHHSGLRCSGFPPTKRTPSYWAGVELKKNTLRLIARHALIIDSVIRVALCVVYVCTHEREIHVRVA